MFDDKSLSNTDFCDRIVWMTSLADFCPDIDFKKYKFNLEKALKEAKRMRQLIRLKIKLRSQSKKWVPSDPLPH